MSFETPVQPVTRRGRASGAVALAAGLLAVGLLVSHPWDPGGASGPGRSALDAGLATASIPAAASVGSALPPAQSSATATSTPALHRDPPSADRFQATWSVVGLRDLAGGGYAIAQEPLEPRPTPRTGMLETATCDLGPAPDVAFLPDATMRLLGVVAPNAERGAIRLTLIDGSIAGALPVLISYPSGTREPAVGLFETSGHSLWPRGGYRFYAVDDAGAGRYLYVCIGG